MSSLSGIREIFSNRNVAVIMVTQTLSMFIAWLWWPYRSLFILELKTTKELLGMLLTVETLSQFLFQLPGGILADRLGRRKVIILSSVIGIGSPLIYLAATHWTHLIPALILGSMGMLSMPARNALIAESLPRERRGAGFAAISTVNKIPRIFTSLLGGILMDYFGVYQGVRMVLLASVVVSILSAFLFWRYITETLDQAVIKERRAAPGGIGSLRELGSMPRNVWVMTIVAGLSAFAVRITFSFTVIYAVEVIGLTKTEYGAIGTAVSLVSTFLTFPGGILADRIGKKTTIVVSRVLSAFSTLGITYAGDFWELGAVRLLGGIASGMGGTFMRVRGGPVWTALVADVTPPESRGRIMGMMGTVVSLVSTPGAWVGGYLYDNVSPASPFQANFLLNMLGTVIFILLLKPSKGGRRGSPAETIERRSRRDSKSSEPF